MQIQAAIVVILLMQAPSTDRKTVWSGVYTAEEATRGQAAFVMSCSACHGAQGDYRQMSPGALDDRTYLDIVARMLQVNGFPVGAEQLTVEGVRKIQIEGKDGPKPVPNGVIVQLVGCLAQDDKNNWIISKGSEPVRTERVQGSTDEELQQAKAKPLGDQTFQTLDITSLAGFEPDAHKGHKIQAKGYLRRLPDRLRIDLTSMEMIAPECQ
jgi:hypothetical protein